MSDKKTEINSETINPEILAQIGVMASISSSLRKKQAAIKPARLSIKENQKAVERLINYLKSER